MCCRGAKQISYNYNYGQFSTFVSGDAASLLQHPQLVSTTWLALASAVWFFVMPQPPKPSMLDVRFFSRCMFAYLSYFLYLSISVVEPK